MTTVTLYASVLARVAALEDLYNNLQNAVLKMVSLDQAEQLGLLAQDGIDELESRVAALEARVNTLENYRRS